MSLLIGESNGVEIFEAVRTIAIPHKIVFIARNLKPGCQLALLQCSPEDMSDEKRFINISDFTAALRPPIEAIQEAIVPLWGRMFDAQVVMTWCSTEFILILRGVNMISTIARNFKSGEDGAQNEFVKFTINWNDIHHPIIRKKGSILALPSTIYPENVKAAARRFCNTIIEFISSRVDTGQQILDRRENYAICCSCRGRYSICSNCVNCTCSSMTCSKCLQVHYCSRDCQDKHYVYHDRICGKSVLRLSV
jgi:hypothetical protein